MSTDLITPSTNYKKGFGRVVLLLGLAWIAVWSVSLADIILSDQHRKLVMFSGGEGPPTFTHLTLFRDPDSGLNSIASASRVIDGERFIFFFDANAQRSTDWVRTMSSQDSEQARSIATWSMRFALRDWAIVAFGAPIGLLLLYLLGHFVFRGFRPKAV